MKHNEIRINLIESLTPELLSLITEIGSRSSSGTNYLNLKFATIDDRLKVAKALNPDNKEGEINYGLFNLDRYGIGMKFFGKKNVNNF